jgi:hypothetical protein
MSPTWREMGVVPDLGKMTTVPLTVLFIVLLFDVNFKRFIYYIRILLLPDPHSPSKIETYYLRSIPEAQKLYFWFYKNRCYLIKCRHLTFICIEQDSGNLCPLYQISH